VIHWLVNIHSTVSSIQFSHVPLFRDEFGSIIWNGVFEDGILL
jgi:hypothetical protein